MSAAIIRCNGTGFTLAHLIARARVYFYVRVLWRELVTILAVSLAAIAATFTASWNASRAPIASFTISAPHSSTLSALALTFPIDAKIFSYQGMTTLAMFLLCVEGWNCNTVFQSILKWSNHAEMLGIDAPAISALVVNHQAGRNRADMVLIRNSMRSAVLARSLGVATSLHSRVTVAV